MKKKYKIVLTAEEREHLKSMLAAAEAPDRVLKNARVLLQADSYIFGPRCSDEEAATLADATVPTVRQVRKRFAEHGFEAALAGKPHRRRRKLDGSAAVALDALLASSPSDGRRTWTLRLLADELTKRGVASVSAQTVQRLLEKRGIRLNRRGRPSRRTSKAASN